MASSSSAPVASAPASAVPAVVTPCFITQMPDLEPVHKTRITAWGNPRCREFRIIPSATGTVVCFILVMVPTTAKGFLRLWITNIKNWKIPSGPVYRPGKLRLMTLEEYRLEMGHSPSVTEACADVVEGILGGVFVARALKEMTTRANQEERLKFLACQKRLCEKDADDAAQDVKRRKLDGFWEVRRRLGDTLEGVFLPAPTVPATSGGPWWCTDAEAALDSWEDVLQSRADECCVDEVELVFD